MPKLGARQRVAIILIGLCLAAELLSGCSGKDESGAAPGYYSGPMQPKSSPKLPATRGGSSAAGQP